MDVDYSRILSDPVSIGRSVFAGERRFTGYEHLAVAIVNQAVIDYRRELKLSMKQNRKTPGAIKLERFFKSEYCDLLSFGMGEFILEKVQQEVINGKKSKKKAIFFCKKQK